MDGDLRAWHESETAFLGTYVGTHEPVDPVAIGEPEGRQAELDRPIDELLRAARAFEEGVVTLGAQRDVHARAPMKETRATTRK
jgi:hypothetical protein